MNTIKQMSETYLRANRTIEQIRVFANNVWKDFFVYNYEGVHFRIFATKKEAHNSASGDLVKPLAEFKDDLSMKKFLQNFNVSK